MEWIVIMGLAICIVLYILFINGYAVTQVKRAIMYVESMKGKRASFSSCAGYTRRIIKFKESKIYHFVFTQELTNGEVSAELLDSNKQCILCLDDNAPSASIDLNHKIRYYLVFRFKSATGKYTLSCD